MKFTYNPRIIKQLGTELITSDSIALSELIKNAYDAKASLINIQFLDTNDDLNTEIHVNSVPDIIMNEIKESHSNLIVIEDNGEGMTHSLMVKGFFEIGTDLKEIGKDKLKENEILLGNKGIGRLSAQRLAPILIVETTTKKDDEIFIVKVEWDEFNKNKDANAPEWNVPKDNKDISYTRIWLLGNYNQNIEFDRFFEVVEEQQQDLFGNPIGDKKEFLKLEDNLLSMLGYLASPFDDSQNNIDLNLFYKNKPISTKFNTWNLAIAEAVHSFDIKKNKENEELKLNVKLSIKPWFLQRIHYNEVGKKLYQDWKREEEFYKKLYDKYKHRFEISLKDEILIKSFIINYFKKNKIEDSDENIKFYLKLIQDITEIEGKIYSFKREKQLLEIAYKSAIKHNYLAENDKLDYIKTFLETHNGIKLYRNGYRIASLGNKDSDWLHLQQKRTTGQQFYRFELGNVLGYVRINDPKQEFISETSSRESITDNQHAKLLSELLDFIFNEKFYELNRNAVEITKDVLDEEELIPKNTEENIRKEADKSGDNIKVIQQNIKAFSEAFKVMKENIALDTPDKVESIKRTFHSLNEVTKEFDDNINNTVQSLKAVDKILSIAVEEKNRIEVETYNNYKLMANGLITETITHELHSLVKDNDEKTKTYEDKFENIEKYLLEQKEFKINKDNLFPIKKRFGHVSGKLLDIKRFYDFIEKTFVYSGKADDFELINLNQFLTNLEERNKVRLAKNNIEIEYDSTDVNINVPRGSLMHIFYNLLDNSIYWIGDRQLKATYDNSFKRESRDKITIRKIDNNKIQYLDSGTGVLEKLQYTLFQQRVSGKENGRGMGLYIIKKFLESFDAKIELLSNLNEFGNRYIFEITFNAKEEN